MKRRRARRRRGDAARQDRHGEPEHQPARPGALPHQAGDPSQHRRAAGASIRCTPMRIRSRMRWRTSRTRSARSSSRTSGRSTTGCSTRSGDLGLLAQPRPHQYEFARLNVTYVITSKRKLRPAGRRGHRRRLGRSAHADDRRAAPARLHAAIDPHAVRAHRHHQGRRLDRLCEPRHRPARRPRRQRAARHGGARPAAPAAHQLGRALRRRGASRGLHRAGASASAGARRAPLQTRPAGLDRARRFRGDAAARASSGSSPATRCG